jgi:hypothetical protein
MSSLMDNTCKTQSTKDKTIVTWFHDDESTLVRTLGKAREEDKWGDNNLKEAAWTVCVITLSGSEKISGGILKDSKSIKSRWRHVCDHHIYVFVYMFS